MKELDLLLKEQKRIRKSGNMVELCEINKRIFTVREKLEHERKTKLTLEKERNFDEMINKILTKRTNTNDAPAQENNIAL